MRINYLLIPVLFGCVAEPDVTDPNLGETDQAIDSNNGKSLNGTSLNGTSLNGKSLNGKSLNGTSLNGKSLNGTALSAVSTTAPPITGSAVVGSTWTGTSSTNDTFNLRIDSALQGTGANSDLWFYGVSYQTTTGWSPICGVDSANAPILAVPVAGVWKSTLVDMAHYGTSTTQFTFACRGKSIAKCVELGYKTYKGFTNQLQACVRLLRADYCGTGVSFTVDGTLLNLYDNVGVQADTETWKPEAEWGTAGATCVNSANRARYDLTVGLDTNCITPRITSATCGTSFANTSTLLVDELP